MEKVSLSTSILSPLLASPFYLFRQFLKVVVLQKPAHFVSKTEVRQEKKSASIMKVLPYLKLLNVTHLFMNFYFKKLAQKCRELWGNESFWYLKEKIKQALVNKVRHK